MPSFAIAKGVCNCKAKARKLVLNNLENLKKAKTSCSVMLPCSKPMPVGNILFVNVNNIDQQQKPEL
jgi:hypothetical protein